MPEPTKMLPHTKYVIESPKDEVAEQLKKLNTDLNTLYLLMGDMVGVPNYFDRLMKIHRDLTAVQLALMALHKAGKSAHAASGDIQSQESASKQLS